MIWRWIFGGAVFAASFLLFLGEPMAAKQLLPTFGGSAAVWMTCLVFFQLALLLGYLYAHWITRGFGRRWQRNLHLALLLVAVAAAIAWAAGSAGTAGSALYLVGAAFPVSRILLALGLRIGLPFVVLGATSPLLQVWFFRLQTPTRTPAQTGPIPYRLFALSNLASLLALLLYPSLIEPNLTLATQRWLWAAGVVLFALLSAALAWRTCALAQPASAAVLEDSAPRTPQSTRMLWFLLPMAASMQLSAITGHITTNIAAIPLLWIVPLAVYLLSFILAFEYPALARRGLVVRLLVVMLAGLGYVLSHADVTFPVIVEILFFLVELFLACLLCHVETYRLRPLRASETTAFYLTIAAGGTAGSFLIGIAAPIVFLANYDVSLSFLVTAILVMVVTWHDGATQRLLWATTSVLLLVLVFALRAAYQKDTMLATRNFYGSLRVRQNVSKQGDPMRTLLNGSIQHGTQLFSPNLMRTPTTYYAEDSGVGLTLANCCIGRPKNIGVVGLGAGTIAAYGKPGDRIRFYEINPAVRPIAQNLFTYLRDSGAAITFAAGDARASLAAEPPQAFDVLVIDAFSGDAIPLHLLTGEAMSVFRRHLAPGGILAFHVSNEYVDLEPEIGELARAAGMQARVVGSARNEAFGEFSATWVLVTSNPTFFETEALSGRAAPIERRNGVKPWTDDYSSLTPILRW